jgi:rSAM/selenodomain-associated transferase 1
MTDERPIHPVTAQPQIKTQHPVKGQLLVLAKHPAPGRVKTRLCPPCTPHQAARIAAAALADTLDAVRQARAGRRILALDATHSTMDGFELVRQRGRGLAERIAHAFADTARHCSAPILQLGMDTPQVDPHLLNNALSRLDDAPAVLGLTEDGGWWALGLRNPAVAQAIRRVPMSTPDTGRLTAQAIQREGIRLEFLPQLRDVDTIEDARAVAPTIPTSRFAAAVAAALPDELACTAR